MFENSQSFSELCGSSRAHLDPDEFLDIDQAEEPEDGADIEDEDETHGLDGLPVEDEED